MADAEEIVIGDMKMARSVIERIVRESVAGVREVTHIRQVGVAAEDDGLRVDLRVVMRVRAVYPETGKSVQAAVAEDVNRMTGIAVREVNVVVDRLDFK